jgi:hypothetical protein
VTDRQPPAVNPLRRAATKSGQPHSLIGVQDWRGSRHLWDTRHTDELRDRVGGGADRAPFFTADGKLLAEEDLPSIDPGTGDPARRTEWVTGLHERGKVKAALAAAGVTIGSIGLDARELRGRELECKEQLEFLRRLPLALTTLVQEVRRLADRSGMDLFRIPIPGRIGKRGSGTAVLLDVDGDQVQAEVAVLYGDDDLAWVPEVCWRRSSDLDLLRAGLLGPEDLHPLVRTALFPARGPAAGPVDPPDPTTPERVRVRCCGRWHELSFHDGELRIPHSTEEQRREEALHAFGDAIDGCFAAVRAWREGVGRLPQALRQLRQELLLRARHGDTPGLLRLLDAGIDPRLRDGDGRTLLHFLHMFDHEKILPRLLAAGLDLEARDRDGRTPLHVAVNDGGSKALVRALLDAGANTDAHPIGWHYHPFPPHRGDDLGDLFPQRPGHPPEQADIDWDKEIPF